MIRLGFLIDKKRKDAIDTASFVTGKTKTELLREAVDLLVEDIAHNNKDFKKSLDIRTNK